MEHDTTRGWFLDNNNRCDNPPTLCSVSDTCYFPSCVCVCVQPAMRIVIGGVVQGEEGETRRRERENIILEARAQEGGKTEFFFSPYQWMEQKKKKKEGAQ